MQRSSNHYDVIIQAVVDQAVKADLVTIPDCSCLPDMEYPFDGHPEYYRDWRKAARAWAQHAVYKTSHWGAHWRGKHVLHVRNRYGVTTLGGASRLQPGPLKE